MINLSVGNGNIKNTSLENKNIPEKTQAHENNGEKIDIQIDNHSDDSKVIKVNQSICYKLKFQYTILYPY